MASRREEPSAEATWRAALRLGLEGWAGPQSKACSLAPCREDAQTSPSEARVEVGSRTPSHPRNSPGSVLSYMVFSVNHTP